MVNKPPDISNCTYTYMWDSKEKVTLDESEKEGSFL